MTPARLLRDLEPLNHDDRWRRLVEVGRQSRTDPRLAETLTQLEHGGWYERSLALRACAGSRDVERLLRGLDDPSRRLRGLAVHLLVKIAGDAQLAEALGRVDRHSRLALLGQLRARGRLAPIDRFLSTLAARADRELEVLLAYGSAKLVERHLARGLEAGGPVFFQRLARYHPRRALDVLRESLPAARRHDPRFEWMCRAALPALANQLPDDVLAFVPELVRRTPPALVPWLALARLRPAATADVVLAHRERLVPDGFFNRLVGRLDRDRLLALARRGLVDVRSGPAWYGDGYDFRWLRHFPAALRAEVYAACPSASKRGTVPVGLLQLLPIDQRQQEARRHLALPSLATQHGVRLQYAALLPWDEALALAEPELRHPDPPRRAGALAALALALPTQRGRAADYLALARARKNEQDPVRMAMLQALAAVPPVVWKADHLEALGGVVRDALDARDLSYGTASQTERLVLRLLARHTDWAVRWLTTLVCERGQLGWHDLESVLTDADVRRVGPALLPVLQAWRRRERDSHTLHLAGALGRRLRAFGGLQDLLENIARTTRQTHTAQHALGLLAMHARQRAADLVPRLLREDPSWITCAPVWGHLHRKRQDLLTPFLGRRPVRGRFSTGKTRFLLPIEDGFFRWTATQQETFAESLRELIADSDPTREVPSVCQALRQLARLPAVAPDTVIAHANDERLAVRDSALIELSRLDGGQGVPVLLEALDDDRARVAIYALRKALVAMPEPHALDLLARVRRDKVTVAKEVVRLVGEFPSDRAFALLAEIEAGGPHRDVRAALLRAVWSHLDRPQAWEMIDRAVRAGDPALMYSVVRIPADRLGPPARERLAALLAGLLDHADATVRVEVLARCAEQPVEDPRHLLLPKVLARADSPVPEERAGAASAAVALCAPEDARHVAAAVEALLPRRRALLALVATLCHRLPGQRRRLGPVARAVLDVLASDPLAATQRVRLAVSCLSGRQLAELLAGHDRANWRPDVLMTAVGLLEGAEMERTALRQLEQTFTGSPSPALRRLALAALLGQARRGWNDDRVARLEAFRGDADALVAAAAQFTLPDDEEAEEDG